MKKILTAPLNFLLLIVILLSSISCEKDKPTENRNNWLYLIDYKRESSFPIETSASILGTLKTISPEVSSLIEAADHSVSVYSVKYNTKLKGNDIVASGLICIPETGGSFPIISFQNGTNSLHANAPSANLYNPLFLYLQCLASNGYIILLPDYIGFGSSKNIVHPYHQKESNNSAVIDLISASEEFLKIPEIVAETGSDLYLMGYSQGGWATLSVLSEIESGNYNFNVKATSCGAGAYNLLRVSEYIVGLETFPGPLYLPYYVYSHNEYGSISYPLATIFNEPYASRIPGLFDGTKSNTQVNEQLDNSISELLTADFILNFKEGTQYADLRSDLTTNSVSAWKPSSKIRFYHGTLDLNVPPTESRSIYQDFMDLGAVSAVEYFELDSLNHSTGATPWGIKTLLWFNKLENK